MKTLLLRAKLYDQKRVYRDLAVKPTTSLYDVASFVVGAFGFDFDHCFGFFSSPDVYGKAKNAAHYELFYDIGEEIDDYTESVEKTIASELFKQPKDKWWMLFDYGDDWVFELEYKDEINVSGKNGAVVKTSGEDPSQY